jgi:putative ABC transport system permease protein
VDFAVSRLPIVAGRPFDDRDTAEAPPVVIINETLAERLWPAQDAVGRRITFTADLSDSDSFANTHAEVVGIAKTGKYVLLWETPRAMLFQPVAQATPSAATLEVLTAGAPGGFASQVRAAMRSVDPTVPIYRMQSMSDYLEQGQALLLFRMGVLLTGIFGSCGLMLASVGLYGVVAYDVSRRTREIGVRIALGALRADILHDVAARAARLAVPGALLGVAIAAAVAWPLRMLFLGVSPFDPMTYGVTALVLVSISLLAAVLPARRAAGANPLDALRAD